MILPSALTALFALLAAAPAQATTTNRTLVVGSTATYPPFAYETPGKEIEGFDVDIIKAVTRRSGQNVRLVNTPFTGVFASLVNGDIDLIISGITITERRLQSYDFTAPYFEARQLIAVHADSPIKGLRDLSGKKVGVVTGSTGDDMASNAFGKTSSNIRRFDTTPLIMAELLAYGVDAVIGDNGVIAYRVQQQRTLKTVEDPAFPKEYFGIVVKKGNTLLRDQLNAGLKAIIADGEYARIYRRWFKDEPPALPGR
jgi:polar amino acid transport system substrate-binding protein